MAKEETFYNSDTIEYNSTRLDSYVDSRIEEKFKERAFASDRFRYYFIVSEPKTYKLYKLEVGKYTYENYDEGDYLD